MRNYSYSYREVPLDYPKPGDADEDWWSELEGCLHGVPWDEDCDECDEEENDLE